MSQRYSVPRPERDRTRRVSVNIGGLSPAETLVIDIAATGTLSITGAAQLNATGALLSAGSLSISGLADLDAVGSLLAAGSLSINGSADLDAVGSLLAAGSVTINGAADLSSASDIDVEAAGSLSITGAASLTAIGELVAVGSIVINGAANLDAGAEPAVAPSVSGGYGFGSFDRTLHLRKKRRDREEQEELAAEIVRLEEHLGVKPSNEIQRIRTLVEDFRRESEAALSNKARRAFDYAERARTQQAWQLAFREYEKAQEQDELNLILSIALDD